MSGVCEIIELPDELLCRKHTITINSAEICVFVGILDGKPVETFATYPHEWDEHNEKSRISSFETTNRLISLLLRASVELEDVVDQLLKGSLCKDD